MEQHPFRHHDNPLFRGDKTRFIGLAVIAYDRAVRDAYALIDNNASQSGPGPYIDALHQYGFLHPRMAFYADIR